MRLSPLPLLAAAALCAAAPRARGADPAKIDPAQQAEQFAPGSANAKPVEKVLDKRADRVQDARAALAGLIDEPTAPLADRRAPIDVTETREKKMVERKDAPLPTTALDHKDSALNGQTARDRFQTADNASRQAGVVAEKYQQGIRNANAASVKLQPDLGRQTTFDQFNRFVFKRNGPGSDGGAALVTAAGGGAATPLPVSSADTTAPASQLNGSGGGIGIFGVYVPPGRPPSAKAMGQWGGTPVSPASPQLPAAK